MKGSIKVPKPMNKTLTIGDEQHVVLPDEVNEVFASLMYKWEITGQPKSVFSRGGEELMRTIISSWQDLYPKESEDWLQMRNDYKLDEMSMRDQIKGHTGRSLASIPLYIHKLMQTFFTEDGSTDRKYYMKLVKKFPIFQMANKV